MRTPNKVLIGGLVLAALIATGGAANTARLEGRVKELESACAEESKREMAKFPKLTLLCEANELARLEHASKSVGIQSQIVNAYRDSQRSGEWPYVLAIVVAFLAAMPWTWYFLLRRIAELRDAIVGKRGS